MHIVAYITDGNKQFFNLNLTTANFTSVKIEEGNIRVYQADGSFTSFWIDFVKLKVE